MTKINFCSKQEVSNIPDLFKFLDVKFMYSLNAGELPKYFDNYFSDIASVHNYQKRFAFLQKYHLPRIKTSLGQLSLKYIAGPSPGFSSKGGQKPEGGAKNQRGGTLLKYCVGCMQQQGGQT